MKKREIFDEFEKEHGYYSNTTSDCELTNWLVNKLIDARIEINTLLSEHVCKNDANPHFCPECSWQCDCIDQPCSCCNK